MIAFCCICNCIRIWLYQLSVISKNALSVNKIISVKKIDDVTCMCVFGYVNPHVSCTCRVYFSFECGTKRGVNEAIIQSGRKKSSHKTLIMSSTDKVISHPFNLHFYKIHSTDILLRCCAHIIIFE